MSSVISAFEMLISVPFSSSRRLPSWVRSVMPRACYVTEKAWNYYPYTITEYTVRRILPPRQTSDPTLFDCFSVLAYSVLQREHTDEIRKQPGHDRQRKLWHGSDPYKSDRRQSSIDPGLPDKQPSRRRPREPGSRPCGHTGGRGSAAPLQGVRGPQIFQVRKNGSRAAEGGLERPIRSHNVFLQDGSHQGRDLDAAIKTGGIRAQGE